MEGARERETLDTAEKRVGTTTVPGQDVVHHTVDGLLELVEARWWAVVEDSVDQWSGRCDGFCDGVCNDGTGEGSC